MSKKQARGHDEQETEDSGLEGVCADPDDAAVVREDDVEGGEELSIGGGPPGTAQILHPE